MNDTNTFLTAPFCHLKIKDAHIIGGILICILQQVSDSGIGIDFRFPNLVLAHQYGPRPIISAVQTEFSVTEFGYF